MTQVDFYQLSRDPPERVVALLAANTLAAGERLLVATADAAQAATIAQALWNHRPDSFLANGIVGEGHEDRQPILIGDTTDPANGARYLVFADGLWRNVGEGFARIFLLFGEEGIVAARERWRALPADGRNFWRQGDGGWEKVV